MDQPQVDYTWLWSFLSALGTGLAGWLFGRKKQNAEVKAAEATAKTSELDNVEKAVAIWRGIASDLEGKFTAMQHQFTELQKANLELQFEVKRLKESNKELQSEIDELKTMLPK